MNEKYPHIDAYRTGQNIKRVMRSKGFTVRDLQEYLSLAVPQTIYRWFEGRNLPSIDNLYALSGLFGVSMDALVAGDREERLGLSGYFRAINAPVTSCLRFLADSVPATTPCSYFHAIKAPVKPCLYWELQQDAIVPQEEAFNRESVSGWRKQAAGYRLNAYYRRLCVLAG